MPKISFLGSMEVVQNLVHGQTGRPTDKATYRSSQSELKTWVRDIPPQKKSSVPKNVKRLLFPNIIKMEKTNFFTSVVHINFLFSSKRACDSLRSCKILVGVIIIIVVLVPGGKQSQIRLHKLRTKSDFISFAKNPTS